jgi:hypothetical protein
LFVNEADANRLRERQTLFLVAAGLKPVGEVTSAHVVQVAGGRQLCPDDPAQVSDLLTTLGLAHSVEPSDSAVRAVVSRRRDLVERYLAATDDAMVGALLGYPRSAVAGCIRDDRLEQSQLTDVLVAERLEQIPGFWLSHDHWRGELGTLHLWREILNRYGLLR